MSRETVFVARNREIVRLDRFLDRSLSGQGQICFVSGVAGSGKTALVTEFARRVQDRVSTLLIAIGQCDAQTGIGDPYLPFREILGQLTGDVESLLASGVISAENANRLRRFLAVSGQALVELGPDLIELFVPLAGLLTRAGTFAAEKAGWLEILKRRTGRAQREIAGVASGINQANIFEQYTNVLLAMAEHQPLLLILDDLHWADHGTMGLLFRLGRRIPNGRINIIGTFRPDEIALGRDGDRHPMEKILAELKREYGDIVIDLDEAADAERRRFVADFLNTEPNRLSTHFRQLLFQHTEGHPLFVIELLRNMQERGDLVLDSRGRWIEGPTLNWDDLPARVEGVIEERVGRLADELREALTVGSVEGERFTAEVVARVQSWETRRLVRALGEELEKRQRLVSSEGIRHLEPSGQRLCLYRFQHNLFRTYLYNELSEAERALFHADVGAALEGLYGSAADEIAVQLAHQFVQAGIRDRARHYLRLAGEQAASRYANDEALGHLSHALLLTPEDDLVGRFDLLLAREQVYDLLGQREHQVQDLEALASLAEELNDDGRRAKAALYDADYARITGDFAAAVASARTSVDLAHATGDASTEALALLRWGGALLEQGNAEAARPRFERALSVAKSAKLRHLEAHSLRTIGNVNNTLGNTSRGKAYLEQSLEICREIGDMKGAADATLNLSGLASDAGNYAGAIAGYQEALQLYREIGHRWGEAAAYNNLGCTFYFRRDYENARVFFDQCLHIRRDIDDRKGQGVVLGNLGAVCEALGDFSAAAAYQAQALALAQQLDDKSTEGTAFLNLGATFFQLGDYGRARANLQQALHTRQMTRERSSEGVTLAHLGLLEHCLGNDERAEELCRQALAIAREVGDRDDEAIDLTRLGHALAGLGHLNEARRAYTAALTIRRALDQTNAAMEPMAGLARISLAQNQLGQAHAYVEQILSHLEGGSLDGTDQPFRVYLSCYRVLEANHDPRAIGLLEQARDRLLERATKIGDEDMRRMFLENVTAHREILRAWEIGP